jgi:uncharacterized membrane protein
MIETILIALLFGLTTGAAIGFILTAILEINTSYRIYPKVAVTIMLSCAVFVAIISAAILVNIK